MVQYRLYTLRSGGSPRLMTYLVPCYKLTTSSQAHYRRIFTALEMVRRSGTCHNCDWLQSPRSHSEFWELVPLFACKMQTICNPCQSPHFARLEYLTGCESGVKTRIYSITLAHINIDRPYALNGLILGESANTD